jgi:hypothetical protein
VRCLPFSPQKNPKEYWRETVQKHFKIAATTRNPHVQYLLTLLKKEQQIALDKKPEIS